MNRFPLFSEKGKSLGAENIPPKIKLRLRKKGFTQNDLVNQGWQSQA